MVVIEYEMAEGCWVEVNTLRIYLDLRESSSDDIGDFGMLLSVHGGVDTQQGNPW